ncbi:SDR family NAD(P)-dependent oxidoreductase [Nocardia rhamnosiphila]|uniref:3-oxoacyl-ACP reductase family protein n=1 Tax=Nocardia rhamnosiphila TaxID=426716 RepID=A0ABV2X259_9NOCA
MRLDGKVAIVTGGARNIGREYCLALAREGASVVVADVLDPGATAREIENVGGKSLGVVCDVSSQTDTQRLVERTVETFGRLDVLVNNAAIYGDIDLGMIEQLSPEAWDKTLAVNLKGPFLCTRAALPVMKEQGSGSIINISSASVFFGLEGNSHYIASKAGVLGLTRSTAREAGPFGVRANSVTPGFTMSQASADLVEKNSMQGARDGIVAMTSLRRVEEPGDLVGAIVFLASDESAFISGQTLNVDGGWFMH